MNSVELSPSLWQKLQQWAPLVVGVGLSAYAAVYVATHTADLENLIIQVGFAGPLISITLQTVFGASPIPTEPLTMINGIVFGPLMGAFYSWIGYMLASVIEYFIGERISRASNFEDQREKLPLGLGRFPVDSPWFLILARIVPGYGPKMVGVVGGMYHVPMWRFIWTAAIPNAIGALAFACGGYGLERLF
ncbi:MAG: TVP38/TMEM64 family protein [Anaerolineae bacterium]|nr:TVP38/TMEM64 family protein [Anaerolineae bacterium]